MIHPVCAQTQADTDEQRRRAQREAEERIARQQAPEAHLPRPQRDEDADALDLPQEETCFRIDRVQLEGARIEDFAWAQGYLDGYSGRCIGRQGIDLIVKRVSAQIVDAGYITTRVGIPEQNLGTGTLRLVLVPGVIRAIRFVGADGNWRNAFPAQPGDLLNLRDLEQGIEQLKRVPSQDADLAIAPGETAGESDVVITLKRGKPWRLSFSFDDSGAKTTGQRQGGLNLAVDTPLQLNDLFSINLSNDAESDATHRGTRGNGLQYSIPWGYWTFSLSGGANHYHQLIQGANQTFLSHGESTSREFKAQRLVHRNQTAKTSLQFRLARRLSRSFVDDAEVEVQRRGTVAAELALVHRRHIGTAQIDLTFARREGIPRFGGQGDAPDRVANSPTNRYRMHTLDATVVDTFKLGGRSLRWSGTFRGQATADKLYAADHIAIGNRYTVRGFDGETTLAAERGWYLRNEIELPLADSGQSLYAGIDHGTVGGASAQALIGRRLTGVAVGLRGSGMGVTYDIFAGWAIDKPAGFRSTQPAAGFQVSYQF